MCGLVKDSKSSGDCWVRSPVCCPDKRADEDALIPKIKNLMSFHVKVYDRKLLALRLRGPLLNWENHTHTQSRAAPWTAAVEKRSAGLDCASVSALGSVVMPGSASFNPPKTA